MDLVVVVAAVAFGFASAQVRLPPFVGYLAAGFALHAPGFESTPVIEEIADVGLLLLFGIGLKLRLRTLGQPTVWGTALVAALATIAVVTGLHDVLGAPGHTGASKRWAGVRRKCVVAREPTVDPPVTGRLCVRRLRRFRPILAVP